MFEMGEEKLLSRIKRRINDEKEFKFLEETAKYLDEEITMDVYDFCLDVYLDCKNYEYEKYFAKEYALRETYDYIFYELHGKQEFKFEECD